MVRVAHFISTSGLYGAERWILGLLNYLDKSNYLLICPSTSDKSLLKEAEKLGISTRLLKVKGNFATRDFIEKLLTLLKKEKIDILHTHGYKSDILGYFAAKKAGIKIISTPHGWSKNAGLKLRLYESLDRFFLRFFDLVVPHTAGFKKSLKHIKKIRFIYNFVDLKTIPRPKKGNPKIITYIGQLIERKRVQDLIISLKYLQDIKLQIVGDGPKKDELKKLTKELNLQNQVKFLGFRKDRLDLLNKSKILVLPSLLEWLPRVAMEAMALERVVITTDIFGVKGLVKHKETGLLVPIKSPKKIAQAINYVIKNKKQAENIGKKARILIEKEFSAKKAAKEFEKLYKNLK